MGTTTAIPAAQWLERNGMHYDTIKMINKYDLWRRELKFESFDEMLEHMESGAKLTNTPLGQYVDEQFELWKESNDEKSV